MFPGMGGRGINPKQLQKQMKSLGIDMYDIEDVKQVIIRTGEKEIIFNDAQVTVMDAKGMKSYQITGTPEERQLSIAQQEASSEKPAAETKKPLGIPEEDVTLVASQAKVSREVARQALTDAGGDLAEAIMKLSGGS
ncbi:MAG TPA: nascent polypeptide-associated complex protein [Methanocella sp.]|nr:nascent polypeptide-associated complex protein [Methanocella sp.]